MRRWQPCSAVTWQWHRTARAAARPRSELVSELDDGSRKEPLLLAIGKPDSHVCGANTANTQWSSERQAAMAQKNRDMTQSGRKSRVHTPHQRAHDGKRTGMCGEREHLERTLDNMGRRDWTPTESSTQSKKRNKQRTAALQRQATLTERLARRQQRRHVDQTRLKHLRVAERVECARVAQNGRRKAPEQRIATARADRVALVTSTAAVRCTTSTSATSASRSRLKEPNSLTARLKHGRRFFLASNSRQ